MARASATATLVSSRRCWWTASSSSARRSAAAASSSSSSEIASSASAMRPAALIRGATLYARSRAVTCSGDSQARASSARSPARCVSASSASPRRTIARLSPVIGARSATVPMAAMRSQVPRHRTAARQQGGRQLVGQAGAGQVRIGIGAIGPMRIHHRHRARQGPGRQVVIGDDHVQAQAARVLDLGHVHDPAVAGDDERHAGSRQALEAGIRQPVALRQPRRNVADRLRAQRPQRDRPDHDRGHAVRVVVTPDGDPLAVVQGALQPRERDVGIGHEAGVVQRLAAGVQEGGELRIVAEAAARQERGDRSTEAREGGRIEERLRQMPLQARSDHAANGSRAGLIGALRTGYRRGAEDLSG